MTLVERTDGKVEERGSEDDRKVLFTSMKLSRKKVIYLRPAFLFFLHNWTNTQPRPHHLNISSDQQAANPC